MNKTTLFALFLSLGVSSVVLADSKTETEHSTETKKDTFDDGTTTKTKSKHKHTNPDGTTTTTEKKTKTTTMP